ncbi:MAG TPA: PepSY domain-containing protein [Sphingomonas sp.]|nr:PepSY domain-containing protein [Sphingomonas sp.]
MMKQGLAAAAILVAFAVATPIVSAGATDAKAERKVARKLAEQQAIRDAVRRGELVPLPRVLAIAQARVAGDVIKTELEQESGGLQYEVKILTATGRVREVKLNARTGAVIGIEDD